MKLLLVEDELALAEALCSVFSKENYITDHCDNGTDGLNNALTGIYDAVVLDVMLPGMNGFEILREMRKNKISTPVIMLTAKSQLEDKIYGLDSGADDYLTKPFETGELLARIRAATRRKGEVTSNTLSFGDLELRQKSGEIFCTATTQAVRLGSKEFQLLEFLMKNQKQIVTKEQLIERVWGYNDESEYNNVEVYISFVRKKLTFVGSTVKIKAVRGMGYSLEESV